MPSFYLLSTFSIAYFFYAIDVTKLEHPPVELHFWCIVTILMSLLSVLVYSKKYNKVINEDAFKKGISTPFLTSKSKVWLLILITVVGILGIVKYVLDYSKLLGAFGIFYNIFMEDTGQLRTWADNVESVGIQISYLSWIAAFILTIEVSLRHINRKWIIAVILIVLCNSIFLDRTRPVWIVFTCALAAFMVTYNKHSRKKIITIISSIIGFFIGIFIFIGAMLGKVTDQEDYTGLSLPKEVQPLFLYLTCSFAYMGRLLYYDKPCEYWPVRSFYPIQKTLASLHLVEQPPNPILDYFSIPFMVNTGTFLEPYFQDGGRIFLILAILLHTFVFDQMALYFMKRISSLAVISIATLCFVDFIAFFVPRATSPAIWFILAFCFIIANFSKDTKQEIH
jgi:oligosaccharide repeat unit polymerase